MIEGLAFSAPWALATLAMIPLLWRFLRVTPPAPKQISFPAVVLLKGLTGGQQTAAAMPLWLAILRILMLIALILALAGPSLGPAGSREDSRTLVMLFDDSWSSAQNWRRQTDMARQTLDEAERNGRSVIILTTAASADGAGTLRGGGILAATDARAVLKSLSPRPWKRDSEALLAALTRSPLADLTADSARILWLHGGIGDEGDAQIAEALEQLGPLEVFRPPDDALPAILIPETTPASGLTARVIAPAAGPLARFTVAAVDESGRTVARSEEVIAAGGTEGTAVFDLPLELANRVARLGIEGQETAGGVLLLDERWKRRSIGLAGQPGGGERPLIDERYYLERALPFGGDIIRRPIDQLVDSPVSAIILTDDDRPAAAESDTLAEWVEQGGVLIQFAGPHLAEAASSPLSPVRLRRGNRSLGGVMSWDQPVALGAFDPAGPFADLQTSDEILVYRQVLAEPSAEFDAEVWARLADGTSLVTARRRGQGWTVLFHVTANADWSNLPLSGLFVEMLERLTSLSKTGGGFGHARPLPPWRSLDGWGRLAPPPDGAMPLDLNGDEGKSGSVEIGPARPPGYYGDKTVRRAVNLGADIGPLRPLGGLPENTLFVSEPGVAGRDLQPWLLSLALLLLCFDTLVTLYLRGLYPRGFSTWPALSGLRFKRTARSGSRFKYLLIGLIAAAGANGGQAHAGQENGVPEGIADEFVLASTLSTRLAFVITGDEEIDRLSRNGLGGLSRVVSSRSAAELADPAGVNPETDDLSFFPLLYWPITNAVPNLSPKAADNLNRFMAGGGSILFDTRDRATNDAMSFGRRPASLRSLRLLARDLNIPPLAPLPADHVLNRSFYLIDGAPGRWAGEPLWVEAGAGADNDGVSPIIVGGNDWAAAWALDKEGEPLYPVSPGGERQREQAYRFGVNLAMYVLTGNYKSDQVHVPAILERLGQ